MLKIGYGRSFKGGRSVASVKGRQGGSDQSCGTGYPYIMSCFKIPQTICEQIESLISKFGGLGFRKFSCFISIRLSWQSRTGD